MAKWWVLREWCPKAQEYDIGIEADGDLATWELAEARAWMMMHYSGLAPEMTLERKT